MSVRRPFLILGCYLLVMGALQVLSESLRWGFHHPSWRLRELSTLLDAAREQPTDVLLVGSSRMMAGVQPRLVEQSYTELAQAPMVCRNLAIEKGDWELIYLLTARHFREAGAPRRLIAEIGAIDYTRERHQLLRSLLDRRDVPVVWSDWPLRDSLELGLAVLGRGPMDLINQFVVEDDDRADTIARGGWVPYSGDIDEHEPEQWARLGAHHLPDLLARRRRSNYKDPGPVHLLVRYLPMVAELCRAHDVELLLLHVPELMESRLSRWQLNFYSEHGQVVEPFYPDLYHADCYKENLHLNDKGSALMSRQVGRFLAGAPTGDVDAWVAAQAANE